MEKITDRWWQDKKDPITGKVILDEDGKAVQEKSDRFGRGLRYRARWFDANGHRRSKSFPDKKLTEAKDYQIKMENDARERVYKDPKAGDISTRAWAKNYIEGRSQDRSSQITVNSLFENQVYPFLGDLRLRNVDPGAIRRWKTWMNDVSGISVNYQADAWDNVSAMLDAAVVEGLIDSNPCKNKSITPPKRIERRIVPWPESKMWAIEHALPDKYKISIPIGAGLGLRHGELLAFSPDKIDRRKMVYLCDRQIIYREGVLYFKLPKNHKVRTIPVSDGLLERIDRYESMFPPTYTVLPWAEQDGVDFDTVNLLITNETNEPWRASMWGADPWRKAFKAAGVPYVNQLDGMHALRHLYASHMLAQGVTIKELAEYLGHSSEAFTLKKYVHMTPSSYDRARIAINAMFPPVILK